jgi:hypothetical protein
MPTLAFETGVLTLSGTIDPPGRMTRVQDRIPLVADDFELRVPHAGGCGLCGRIVFLLGEDLGYMLY